MSERENETMKSPAAFNSTVSGGKVWTPVAAKPRSAFNETVVQPEEKTEQPNSSNERYRVSISPRLMVAVAGTGSVVGALLYYM